MVSDEIELQSSCSDGNMVLAETKRRNTVKLRARGPLHDECGMPAILSFQGRRRKPNCRLSRAAVTSFVLMIQLLSQSGVKYAFSQTCKFPIESLVFLFYHTLKR